MVWFLGGFNFGCTSIINLSLQSAVTMFYERSRPRGTPTTSFTVTVANSQLSNLQRWWFSRNEWRECWRDEAQTSSGRVENILRCKLQGKHHDTREKRQAGVPSSRFRSLSGQLKLWNYFVKLLWSNWSLALADRSGLFCRPLVAMVPHQVGQTKPFRTGVFSWCSLRSTWIRAHNLRNTGFKLLHWTLFKSSPLLFQSTHFYFRVMKNKSDIWKIALKFIYVLQLFPLNNVMRVGRVRTSCNSAVDLTGGALASVG